jgi:hypothetical protein
VGTDGHDLVVETRETPLIVGDQFRIEGSLPVARNPVGDYPATIMPAGCGSNPLGKAGAMSTRTRSLLDLLLALVVFALLAGIYLAASHAIDWQLQAAVNTVQERQ